jgi:signal transduction histidine kinase
VLLPVLKWFRNLFRGELNMDKIPLISLVLYSFPESLVLISLGSALYGYNVKENYKKILLYGLISTIAAYFIRALPLPFGVILTMQIIIYIVLTSFILRLNLIKAVFIVLTFYVILQVAESIILPLMIKVLNVNFDKAVRDPLLRLVLGWSFLSPLALLAFFIIRKKISFVAALNLLEPKTPSGKMILWLVSLILLQAVIGLTINLVFYNNVYQLAPVAAIFDSLVFGKLLGILLVILPLTSILMIRKLFAIVEKENIIASQEAFIDNINNLFSTIRAQRHDFLNHVQILDSYLKMNKLEEARAYMADIMEETKEINEIIVINNPFLNALIQAKMGIAERYKIDFVLDIHTALTDLDIKPFDLVKIMGNLINNAIEAVKDLDNDNRQVKLTIKKHDNNYIIKVFNPRPVIPTEILEKIFEGGFSTKTGGEHCGVGLAVVKNLTEKYKGLVSVHSSEPDGTTFTVILPST